MDGHEKLRSSVDPKQTPARAKSSLRWRLVGYAVVAVLLVAYVTPIVLFLNERTRSTASISDKSHDVALDLKITVADFVKGTVTFHVLPAGGTLMGKNGRLMKEVVLETDPGTGLLTHTFKPDIPLTPWVVTTTPDSGDILDYPFDRYTLDLEILARSEGKPVSIGTEVEEVPHGFRAKRVEQFSAQGDTEIQVTVARTGTIIFVALLSTVSLLLVSIAACAVAWHVAMHNRKIEFSMMIWTAALLFVIPTVRNSMPGGAPTGALIDYIIFFWLQIAIAVAMATLVLTWVRRPAA